MAEEKKVNADAINEMKELVKRILNPVVGYSRDPLKMANEVISMNQQVAEEIEGILCNIW